MGMFDDLVPEQKKAGMFDDLVPASAQGGVERQAAEAAPAYDEQAAKDRMYEGRARYMREKNPTLTGVRDTVSRFVEGTPVGSWFDEGMALASSSLPEAIGGSGLSYEDAKGLLDADRRIRDAESTKLGTLPVIGDVTVGGVNKLAGAIASAPFTPMARVMQGGTIVPTVANAVANGVGYGAIYGAGEGNDVGERAANAGIGAAIGGVAGAAVPAVARGAQNVTNYARSSRGPIDPVLQGFDRGAVNRVADDMATSRLTPQQYAQQARELGEEGMLLDMGADLTGTAETLAQTHGPQRQIMQDALEARQAAAPDRIRRGINYALGRDVDLPQYVEASRRAYSDAARPHYETFHNTSIPLTPGLRETMRRIPASAFNRARTLMEADGHQQQFRLRPVDEPMSAMTGVQGVAREQVPTGIEYDYLKRAVDDIAQAAERGSNEQRIYSGLARRLRGEVDNILSPGDPSQSSWAQGRALAGEGLEGREAAELGRGVFSGRRDPNTVRAELAELSQHGQDMYRRGARDDLRGIMGRAATNFRPNGDATARRALNSEFARENIDQIVNPNRPHGARILANRIDAENTMADSFNQIMSNSATARRQAGQSRLPWGAGAPVATEAPRSLGEAAFSVARRGVNALLNGALGERAGRIMADQARMLTARGIDRDTYVQALFRLANHRNTTQRQLVAIESMLRALGEGSRAPIISNATQTAPAQ